MLMADPGPGTGMKQRSGQCNGSDLPFRRLPLRGWYFKCFPRQVCDFQLIERGTILFNLPGFEEIGIKSGRQFVELWKLEPACGHKGFRALRANFFFKFTYP